MIIDVGAGDTDEMAVALGASDCAIVPVRPTAVDVWTMTLMDNRIGEARSNNPGLVAWVADQPGIHQPQAPGLRTDPCCSRRGCTELSVAGPVLCDRVAFQRAYAEGKTVTEYRQRSEKAADEIAALFRVGVRR